MSLLAPPTTHLPPYHDWEWVVLDSDGGEAFWLRFRVAFGEWRQSRTLDDDIRFEIRGRMTQAVMGGTLTTLRWPG